jgi:hypothetical protein
VRLWSVEGGVSRGSQVSDRDRMSRLLSKMSSWREQGLSRSRFITEADLVLKWEMLMLLGKVGPGFTSMSPARSRIRESRGVSGLRGRKVMDCFLKKKAGMESREVQTEEFGIGW